MSIKRNFGIIDGKEVYLFTIKNSKGMIAEVSNYGGTLVSLKVQGSNGKFDDVVLGYDTLEDYRKYNYFFGATIGRVANRIGTASFEINGTKYNVAKNEGENHIHGGVVGFDKKVWEEKIGSKDTDDSIELSYLSVDGEEGYPGNLNVSVKFTVSEDNELKIEYNAISDKDTIVNLTNHSYFNLSGQGSGDILKHQVMINADKFTKNNKNSIPTGEIADVNDTPMDFRKLTYVGENISSSYEQIVFGNGYDHNYIINTTGKKLEKAAEAYDEKSGRVMEVYTTKPGVQFYTANFLTGQELGKGGATYNKRDAFCFETQYFPNAINTKNFESPILKAKQNYEHKTIYKFSVR
ncbi:aldose epimerase family protein [Clostridium estertheticum]|uniref:Aldose 1-epimerase n=1 Tax=Clostridium estertheticum TaxID=238834 RepID=A0AA47EIK0_9CLOT|nr:aldose epimerase family protein [Clostridium estertheticum]MBU3153325.1 galactose mutarotase [Clostridium estertheticum]WAG60735.1 galactose mutarotase [Clostridium estertheticum]